MAGQTQEAHAKILGFWKAVELFSPQKIPAVNPNSRREPVFRTEGETPLPWDSSNWFPSPDDGHVWRFNAYCGVYRTAKVRVLLEQHFGSDDSDFDERVDGETCLFSIQISGDGRPLLDTFVLASSAWATGRLVKPGPTQQSWLEGFEQSAEEASLSFRERFAILDNDEIGRELNRKLGINVGRPLQPGDLESEVERISKVLNIAEALTPKQVRIECKQKLAKNAYKPDDEDFLNSFFLRDLNRLTREAAGSNLSKALSEYLTPEES
jgi:hypothetical protein